MMSVRRLILIPALLTAAGLTACGTATATSSTPPPSATDSGGVAPVGGDIPDNQVYLTYTGSAFTIKYPEGWVQAARSDGITFRDKDNQIAVSVSQGAAPTVASVRANIQAIAGASMTTDSHAIDLPGGAAILATYRIDGSADPVTGKKPHLSVDRYELAGSGGRKVVMELGNPVGADNVDAYHLIAQSFRWR